jgi:hypothetical protein
MPIAYVLCLASCIWPDAISQWIRQRNSIRLCAKLGKSAMETSVRGRKHEPYTESPDSPRPVKSKVHSLWHQGDCSQRIHPGRPNSQFRILLWRFTVTVWKCVKTSSRTLVTKDLTVASWQHTISHFIFTREFLTKTTWVLPAPTTSRVMVASRPKVLDQTVASVPEIMNGSLYSCRPHVAY